MNPYKQWLGISTAYKPDHFQLLGIARDENDLTTIESAARLQLRKLKKHVDGEFHELALEVSNRIKKAHRILSDPDLRQDYVELLEEKENEVARISDENEIVVPIGKKGAAENQTEHQFSRASIVAISIASLVSVSILTGVAVWFSDVMVGIAPEQLVQAASISEPEGSSPPLEVSQDSSNPSVDSLNAGDTDDLVDDTPEMSESIKNEDSQTSVPETSVVKKSPAPVKLEEPDTPAVEVVQSVPVGNTDSRSDKEDVVQDESPFEPAVAVELPETETTKSTDPVSAVATEENTDELTATVHSILKSNCFSCHGEAGEEEGGFGFVLNRDELVSAGYVIPKNPGDSLLLERLVSEDSPMPPEGEEPRPTTEEIEVVHNWILAGAPPLNQIEKQPFVTRSEMYRAVANDLKTVGPRDREFTRYFSTTHLANAGYSPQELKTNQFGIAKLLNSLSWNRNLAGLRPVKELASVYRIDLRELKWTQDHWNNLLLDYPYGVLSANEDEKFIRMETSCEISVIRGDWFVGEASRPPLYHELLEIPDTDLELEQLLQVDVQRNLNEERVQRIGFARSGVSQNNRLVERHESAFGAYWKSYDFAGNTGRKNLFEHPLGPRPATDAFLHDGGEIIFQLPNGMLAYMLTDATGKRIDRGPVEIVSDPRQPDRTVVNGVSCMSCHYGGFIQKTDEIRNHVLANASAYLNFKKILALYPESEKVDPKIETDTRKYLDALASSEIGIQTATRIGEPVVLVSNRYENELDLSMASSELGLLKNDLLARLDSLVDDDLTRTIGVLKSGGVVKRETFDDIFVQLIRAFELGEPSVISISSTAKRRLAKRKRESKIGFSEAQLKTRNTLAQSLLRKGAAALNEERWVASALAFEEAIRVTPDLEVKLSAFRQLIPIYERQSSIDNLINAHKFLMDSTVESGLAESARDRFYISIVKFIQRQANPNWQRDEKARWNGFGPDPNMIPSSVIFWEEIRVPGSVATAIATTFEAELRANPEHEPTLLVLQTLYDEIRRDDARSKTVLLKLQKIRERRGQVMKPHEQMQLASTFVASGEFRKAAELYEKLNQTSVRSSSMLMLEANAWKKLGQKDKALNALRQSEESMEHDTSDYRRTRLADQFLELGDPDSAIRIYTDILQAKPGKRTDKYRTRDVQKKLVKALALSKTADPAKLGVEELLDPRKQFRDEAIKLEAKNSGSPGSRCKELIEAAENWSKAEEFAKAESAVDQAVKLLVSSLQDDDYKVENLSREAGLVYRSIGKYQKAFDQMSIAIKRSDSKYEIEKDQQFIRSLLNGENAIPKTDEMKALIDAGFQHRSLAAQLEAKKPYSDSSAAQNLIRATELWIKSGDEQEILRCGKKAENAIGGLKPDNSYTERYRKELADLYSDAELDQNSIEQYVIAITLADRDEDAEDYFDEIKELCKRSGLPLPTLPKESQVKLDPLNRFRVKAMNYEVEARKIPELATSQLLLAVENWLKASEKNNAERVAGQVASLLLNRKRDGMFANRCTKLAAFYVHLENVPAARQYYQLALESETNESTKKSIQEALNGLQ